MASDIQAAADKLAEPSERPTLPDGGIREKIEPALAEVRRIVDAMRRTT